MGQKKGYKQTEEHKRKVGEASKLHWQNPEYREKVIKAVKETKKGSNYKHSEEAKRKMSLARKKYFDEHPEQRKRMKLYNPLKRPGIKARCSGRNHHMYGRLGENNPNYGSKRTIEIKKKMSKLMIERLKNTEYVKKIMKARYIKPNKAETKLNKLLQQILPNEYKYVGDGEFILASRCPDFININGQKKIIELYGNYWHKNDNPQDRIDLFKKYGYESLVVWEKELNNKQNLKTRILNFHF